MNANEHFAAMGFSEWATALSEVVDHGNVDPSGFYWRDVELLKSRTYSLHLEFNTSASTLLDDFSVPVVDMMWLSLNDTEDTPVGMTSVCVSDVDVIKEVIISMAEHIKIFFISPVSSIRKIDKETGEIMRLSSALEDINMWVQSEVSPSTTIIFVDCDMDIGRSDAKAILHRYCELKLK
jgi:hypothetical protein